MPRFPRSRAPSRGKSLGYTSTLGAVVGVPTPLNIDTLSQEEAQQLVAAADTPWNRYLVILLLTTGMRRGEAVAIALDDITVENGQLLVHRPIDSLT